MTKEEVIEYVEKYGTKYVHIDWLELLNTEVHGINKSRYLASWFQVGGSRDHFEDWLRSLIIDGESLTDEEVSEIKEFASGGKMELEHDAEKFLSKR